MADMLTDGFEVLEGLLTPRAARRLDAQSKAQLAENGPPAPWTKAAWVRNPLYSELVNDPRLVGRLKDALGDDIILWGVEFLTRKPGQVHPWHSDIESSEPSGGFVSAWIGLSNVTRESTLRVVSGSHQFGQTVQDQATRDGLKVTDLTDDTLLSWARSYDSDAKIETPSVTNGDAILFDGRLWHGTQNTQSSAMRSALLVQYARADKPVRMFDFSMPGRPVPKTGRPPVGVIAGNGRRKLNRTLPVPKPGERWLPHIARIRPGNRPEGKDFHPKELFKMRSQNVLMDCHFSVLAPGASPHPLHQHAQEELLIILDGAATAQLGRRRNDPNPRQIPLEKGQFTYYRRWHWHTITNTSDRDVTYIMLRWTDPRARLSPLRIARRLDKSPRLASGVHDVRNLMDVPPEKPFQTRRVFDQPTAWTRTAHCHLSRLKPDGGYGAHRDKHDVALILLKGTIRVGGERLKDCGIAWLPAGSLHGMKNVGDSDASYLTFEFHNSLRRGD